MKTATKKYSSKMIQELALNTKWNFWSSDWSKRIVVDWSGGEYRIPLAKFVKQVRKLVGSNFKYERALNNDPIEFIVTENGLTPKIDIIWAIPECKIPLTSTRKKS